MLDAAFASHADGSRILVVVHRPDGPARGRVLLLPPFFEELNKARRMLALQAAALCAAGWAVVVPDLRGTGDADGELSDVGFAEWIDDLACAEQWSRGLAPPTAPLLLWSLRAGSLLVPRLVERLTDVPRPAAWIAWQPVAAGRQFLRQFLRTRVAAEQLQGGSLGVKDLLAQLDGGDVVEVAGYPLGGRLATDLRAASLDADAPVPPVVDWFDVGAVASPATADLHAAWRDRGVALTCSAIDGAPFWATQEITEVGELLVQTRAAVARVAA